MYAEVRYDINFCMVLGINFIGYKDDFYAYMEDNGIPHDMEEYGGETDEDILLNRDIILHDLACNKMMQLNTKKDDTMEVDNYIINLERNFGNGQSNSILEMFSSRCNKKLEEFYNREIANQRDNIINELIEE